MREPCAVGRIMLAAGAYSDFRIKARLFMVFGQEYLQSVIQLENMGIERILRVWVVYAPVACRSVLCRRVGRSGGAC